MDSKKKTKPFKVYFQNELKTKLTKEFELSKKYFVEKIDSFGIDAEKVSSYLKVNLNSLVYLIDEIKTNPEINRFQINLSILYQIVDFLIKRFNVFLSPSKFPIFKEAEAFFLTHKSENVPGSDVSDKINEARKTKKIKVSPPITGFKWKNNPSENTLLLHKFLEDNDVIEVGTEKPFEEAFSGNVINEPLRIKWLYTTNRNDTKPVIIKIINLLMDESELGLLKKIEVQAQLARTIENIFVDPKGQPIKDAKVTISGMKKSKGVKTDLKTKILLTELRAVEFNAKQA